MVESKSKLYVIHGVAVYWGPIIDNKSHKHYAHQIAISLNEKFQYINDNREYYSSCQIILSGEEHRIISNEPLLLVLIEPEISISEDIISRKEQLINIINRIENISDKIQNCDQTDATSYINNLLNIIGISKKIKHTIEPRVKKVIELIENLPEKKIALPELASKIALSESRLQHLFKQEMGISIKHYLLWKRIINGIVLAVDSNSLTTAAYSAGFADSAHMSRTFKNMFGLNLSKLFKNSSSVQFFS